VDSRTLEQRNGSSVNGRFETPEAIHVGLVVEKEAC
jgi:hypothetical protein